MQHNQEHKQSVKQRILARCDKNGVSVTAQREAVLDIILDLAPQGVIKAYAVLAVMQQQKGIGTVAPPTAYRALDFWAEHGVLHRLPSVNGYVLCRHNHHDCAVSSGGHAHGEAFILVCTACGIVREQSLSGQWSGFYDNICANGFFPDEEIVLTGLCDECRTAAGKSS